MWIQRTLPDIPLIWVGSAAFSKKLLNCEGNCWRRSFRRRGSLHEFRSSLHLSSGTCRPGPGPGQVTTASNRATPTQRLHICVDYGPWE